MKTGSFVSLDFICLRCLFPTSSLRLPLSSADKEQKGKRWRKYDLASKWAFFFPPKSSMKPRMLFKSPVDECEGMGAAIRSELIGARQRAARALHFKNRKRKKE